MLRSPRTSRITGVFAALRLKSTTLSSPSVEFATSNESKISTPSGGSGIVM